MNVWHVSAYNCIGFSRNLGLFLNNIFKCLMPGSGRLGKYTLARLVDFTYSEAETLY